MTGAADLSNFMDKYGVVFPIIKALALGAFFGNKHRRQDEEFPGVCAQIAPDCGDWWSHIDTANEYDGGAISRNVAEERIQNR